MKVVILIVICHILYCDCIRIRGGNIFRGIFRGGGAKRTGLGTNRGRGSSIFGSSRSNYYTVSGRPRTSLYSRSAYVNRRQSVNSNGFGLGLGYGLLLGK